MKKKVIADIVINSIIVLSVFIGMTIHIFLSIGDGPLDGGGIYTFRYFTNLSNVFCGIIALWTLIVEILILAKKKEEVPFYLVLLRQIASVGVLVTFVSVNFMFLPLLLNEDWFNTLYFGQKIMTHVTTPILSAVSFIFFAPGKAFTWKGSFFSIIPEFIYAIVYEIEVPILNNWKDFYGFTLGGRWYAPFIVTPVICLIAYGSSVLLSLGHKKWQEHIAKKEVPEK